MAPAVIPVYAPREADMMSRKSFLKAETQARLFSFSLMIACAGLCHGVAGEPTLILLGGKIVTVDAKFTVAEAIAIESNRIVRVGPNDEVLKLAGTKTEVIDLGGKTVMPGLDRFTYASGGGSDDGV